MGKTPKSGKSVQVNGLPKELAQKAIEFFEFNKAGKPARCWVTSDGHVFAKQNPAINHMVSANLKCWEVTQEVAENAVEDAEAEAKAKAEAEEAAQAEAEAKAKAEAEAEAEAAALAEAEAKAEAEEAAQAEAAAQVEAEVKNKKKGK